MSTMTSHRHNSQIGSASPESLFDTIRMEAYRGGFRKGSQQAIDWFKRYVATLRMNPRQVINSDLARANRAFLGSMYLYFY